jgi:hypothetical protein
MLTNNINKSVNVLRNSQCNNVSLPSSFGIEPVSSLWPYGTEWQGNVSKRGMLRNYINKFTYEVPIESTLSVLRVPSELNPWDDSQLTEQNGKKMWASVTFMRTRQTNPRTEKQWSQRRHFSEFARNGTRELILSWWKRMELKCEQAWHSYEQD